MAGNPLEQYLGPSKPRPPSPGPSHEPPISVEGEAEREGPLLRLTAGVALMLEIEYRSGDREAFSYAYLSRAKYDKSTGISLTFGEHEVQIKGRCLEGVFAAITSHTAMRISESPEEMQARDGEVFVESIRATKAG